MATNKLRLNTRPGYQESALEAGALQAAAEKARRDAVHLATYKRRIERARERKREQREYKEWSRLLGVFSGNEQAAA